MNARGIHANWIARLLFLLILAHLSPAIRVLGQDAPAAGDEPQTEVAPASEPSQSPALYNNNTGGNDAGVSGPAAAEEPSAFDLERPGSPSDLGTPLYVSPRASAIRGAGQDVNPNPLNVNPMDGPLGLDVSQSPKLGEAQGSISISAENQSSIPFVYRGFAPEDADLKVGPLYFKLESLEADMLYSDNYDQTETDRRSEVLAIIQLNMTMIAQLSEGLQIAVNGTLIYLPLQNIVGLESTSFYGNFPLLLPLPTFLSQVTYDTLIAGWYVRFQDQINAQPGSYADSTQYNYNLFSGSVLDQDRDGKYTFHSGHVNLRGNSSTNEYNQNDNFFVYSNTLSVDTSRMFPGDVLFSADAYRQDLWYNQGNRGLPTSRDDLFLEAQSERENLRFKPFISYEISHTSDVEGVYQTINAGVSGPITDQLFLYSGVGYYVSNTGNQGVLWNLTLAHTAGPDTTEYLEIARALNDFDDEVLTTEYYRITQSLGPTLAATVFADHSDYQELSSGLANGSQDDVGAQLTWFLGPKTSLTLSGIYTHQNYSDGTLNDSWTGRADLQRRISDTVFFRAIYQYERFDTNQSGQGYFENLVYLSLAKSFY